MMGGGGGGMFMMRIYHNEDLQNQSSLKSGFQMFPDFPQVKIFNSLIINVPLTSLRQLQSWSDHTVYVYICMF